jgi:hypothetical protein
VSAVVNPELEQRIRDAYAAFAGGHVERLQAAVDVLDVSQDVPMAHVLQIDEEGRVTQLAWYAINEEAAAAAGL